MPVAQKITHVQTNATYVTTREPGKPGRPRKVPVAPAEAVKAISFGSFVTPSALITDARHHLVEMETAFVNVLRGGGYDDEMAFIQSHEAISNLLSRLARYA